MGNIDIGIVIFSVLVSFVFVGVINGVRDFYYSRRKPIVIAKFIAYPPNTMFTNESDAPVNIYCGEIDKNGNPTNLKLIEVLQSQRKEEESK